MRAEGRGPSRRGWATHPGQFLSVQGHSTSALHELSDGGQVSKALFPQVLTCEMRQEQSFPGWGFSG